MIYLVQNPLHDLDFNLVILMNINLDSGTINPICACGTEIETPERFLLHCQFYTTQSLELFEKLLKVEPNFLGLSARTQVLILLYGSRTISENLNQEIFKNVIFYLKATTRFDRPLIDF